MAADNHGRTDSAIHHASLHLARSAEVADHHCNYRDTVAAMGWYFLQVLVAVAAVAVYFPNLGNRVAADRGSTHQEVAAAATVVAHSLSRTDPVGPDGPEVIQFPGYQSVVSLVAAL